LGIGDWAQSPIPNPQSPIPNPQSPFIPYYILYKLKTFQKKIKIIKKHSRKKLINKEYSIYITK
jgi:hypothetical protein